MTTPTIETSVHEFLAQKRIAVVDVSPKAVEYCGGPPA
jgi:hypothetical protein